MNIDTGFLRYIWTVIFHSFLKSLYNGKTYFYSRNTLFIRVPQCSVELINTIDISIFRLIFNTVIIL